MDPVILFFLLGLAAGMLRSELRLPPAVYEFLTVVLLLSIGLKGGVELAQQSLLRLLPEIVAVIGLGVALTLIAYPLLRGVGRFPRPDAASIAAHYGSVSVGTYAVALAYLTSLGVDFEEHIALFLVVLEMPAIVVGVALAKGISRDVRWRRLFHEIFLGKSLVLLTGGLLIGWAAGPQGVASIEGLFFGLFKGVLALFLLEMGLLAAAQMAGLRRYGLFLIGFGVVMPLIGAAIGAALGWALALSVGGTALLATLAGSASYIAVPAAMRLTVPESDPTLSLAASLGVTFPFNVFFGIPLYLAMAQSLHGSLR
ncbi:MAG TPA: sodium-dependent bicarbonate transport family permease [Thermoanaerobaculia bacterium]|nr:sodium-dependent bicarbonate transport family permease [Thermoanaerobaculia bacterium]